MVEKSVLFVDDESHILTSLKRLLRKEPYRVHTAVGGAAGLEVLAANEIQMVVSDQRMPEMTGTQFLQKVKESYPDTVRLVLSGYAEAGAIVDAINTGEVYRFIGKPWEDESLKLTLRQCLEHYDMIQENRRLTEQSARQLAELQRLNQLLAGSVESRTRSLQFSQEVLESLPRMVLGISQEEEIVLTNGSARAGLPALAGLMPGADIREVLPPEAVAAIRGRLADPALGSFQFEWEGRRLTAEPARLGSDAAPRGCILLLEDAS